MPHDREKFAPRLVDTREMERLRQHVERVIAHGHPERLPTDWREEIAYDFSECPHTAETLIEVEGPHGIWGMAICNNCGEQVVKECPHVRCDWLLDGKLLRCANCGIDGT